MRINRCYQRNQRERFIQDPDITGAYIQAFEKHRSTRLLLKQSLSAYGILGNIPLLRRISRFVTEKMEQRARFDQLRGFILQITRDNLNGKASTEKPLCPVEPPVSAPLSVAMDRLRHAEEPSPLIARTLHTGRCDERASTINNDSLQSPAICSPTRSCPSSDNKCTLLRRPTFCGTPLMASNPLISNYTHDRVEPPLTPVRQIIRTPLHPPQLERHGPRTPFRGNRTSAGVDINFEHQVSKTDFPDTPCNDTCSNRKVFTPRDRLSTRRLSYPHSHTASSSYFCSPFNIPSLATAFDGCQDLASPLTIRSSNPTASPCTPQIVKGRGSARLQWSPHCLGCFA